MSNTRKTLTAVVGALLTTGAALAAYFGVDSELTSIAVTGAGTLLTALGVYVVPNRPSVDLPPPRTSDFSR